MQTAINYSYFPVNFKRACEIPLTDLVIFQTALVFVRATTLITYPVCKSHTVIHSSQLEAQIHTAKCEVDGREKKEKCRGI